MATIKTEAYIAAGATVNAGAMNIEVSILSVEAEDEEAEDDTTDTYKAEATSGAGSGKIGIAGPRPSMLSPASLAYSAGSVTIIPVDGVTDGNVVISADIDSESITNAGTSVEMSAKKPPPGGRFFCQQHHHYQVRAYIADNATLAGRLI